MVSTARLRPLLAALSVARALFAQAPPPLPSSPTTEPPTFAESIDVRVVNVEAVVTDSRGERVHHLKKEDLQLLIDGREVPIDYFAEVGGDPEGVPIQGAPAETGNAPQGRSIVIFLDDSFSVKSHRDMVLKKLGEQLAQLQADDRVALVAFDGERLTILTDWTADPAAVRAALLKAQSRRAGGIAKVAIRRMNQDDLDFQAKVEAILAGLDDARPGAGGQTDFAETERSTDPRGKRDLVANDRSYFRPLKPLLGDILTDLTSSGLGKIPIAVTAAMRAFSNTPGRKVMLLLSGGWPRLSVVAPIAGEANRLGFTLYPVDVTGVDRTFLPNDARTDGAGSTALGKDGWESAAEYHMELLARATGGKASLDSTRLEALPRLLSDTRSYYWLSFSPHWRGDDHSHRIAVKAVRPDLKVRARRSFADFSAESLARLNAEGILLLGGDESSRQLKLEPAPVDPNAAGGGRLPFLVSVPVAAFAQPGLEEGPGERALTLAVQSLDPLGNRALFPEMPIRLPRDPAAAPKGMARFTVALRVARKSQTLLFTLRDPTSGVVLWGELRIQLPAPAAQRR